MVNYDAFAETFSNSRKNMKWPEIDVILEDIEAMNYRSILDVGCGNGRLYSFIEKEGYSFDTYLGVDSSEGMISEAKKLHPDTEFRVCSMPTLEGINGHYDAIVLLASFHHLETPRERRDTLRRLGDLLSPHGRIYMTNWNLLEQKKYEKNHRENGDFDIKIGEYSRYYHGFRMDELEGFFSETGFNIISQSLSDQQRNILSILSIG